MMRPAQPSPSDPQAVVPLRTAAGPVPPPGPPPIHSGLQPEQIRACPVSAKNLLAQLTRLTNQHSRDMEYAKQTIGTLMSIQIAQQQRHEATEQELAQHKRRLEYHDLSMEIFRGNAIFLPTPVDDTAAVSELPTVTATDVVQRGSWSNPDYGMLLTSSDDSDDTPPESSAPYTTSMLE
jgi:hypothetical protein